MLRLALGSLVVVTAITASRADGAEPAQAVTTSSSVAEAGAQTQPTPGVELVDGVTPLVGSDAADPFVIMVGEQAWLLSTNTADGNVPIGTRVGDETVVVDALPVLPAWVTPGFTWAPAVTEVPGGYVLAFTALHTASGRQCIGVATSGDVDGPYTPVEEPLACDVAEGGSIDPSFVRSADGTLHLVYKVDGNCCDLPTPIRSVPLRDDGTARTGDPVDLLVADQPWEGELVEAPSMQRVGDRWLLLYSANRWDGEGYAVGAAWCQTPTGPCTKTGEPVLASSIGVDGPGGAEFVDGVSVGGAAVVAFHAWPAGTVGYDAGGDRRLHLARVEVNGDEVRVVPSELAA